jgi:hypothetical protein
MTANSQEPPYMASWTDRFKKWVDKLPVRAWVFYVGLGIVLILVQVFFLWLNGGLEAEELLPVIIFNGLAVSYLLASIHLLDHQAMSALDSMRPVLDTTEQEFDDYQYRLSNMPLLAPLIAGLVVTVAPVLAPLVAIEPVRYAALGELPIFAVVYHIIDKSSALLFGVVIYHSVRQLRLVNSISSHHIRINLFHLSPLQAFSRLTATTAVGLVVFVYAWMLINPELLADPVLLGFALVLTALAVAVFVWPLWSVHRLMELEKTRALHEIDLRFEAVFSKLDQSLQVDDYATMTTLNGTIASLEIQHRRISAVPTWPWSPETARIALTAIALPLVLMILQFLVLQVLER